MANKILEIFNLLMTKNGKQNWWPIDIDYHIKNKSDYRFEIIIGSILTQNTTWNNVEKTIVKLKNNRILDIKKINKIKINDLKKLIRESGFYNKKAELIKNFAYYLDNNYNCNLDLFFNREIDKIRNELLSLKGIGQETADSIILYAGNKPTFIVDSYTKRICERIPVKTNISYNEIKEYFESELSKIYQKDETVRVYKELHALIVLLCKKYCKKNPNCDKCIINSKCEFNRKNL